MHFKQPIPASWNTNLNILLYHHNQPWNMDWHTYARAASSSTSNMMKKFHMHTIGLNLPSTAVRNSYGIPRRSNLSTGKPSSTKGRNWVSTREPTCSNSTAEHPQYACHATQQPKHTTTYSSANTPPANKSPMSTLHKSTKSTANGRSQLK
jgi:hypothetical protein